MIIGLIALVGCQITEKNKLGKLEYDIIVEKESTRTEGLNTSEIR